MMKKYFAVFCIPMFFHPKHMSTYEMPQHILSSDRRQLVRLTKDEGLLISMRECTEALGVPCINCFCQTAACSLVRTKWDLWDDVRRGATVSHPPSPSHIAHLILINVIKYSRHMLSSCKHLWWALIVRIVLKSEFQNRNVFRGYK